MATRGPEKERAGKLFTHTEIAQKKYFICLGEIRTENIYVYIYVIITLHILRSNKILNIYI
jgi:hypothetical protein